MNGGVRKLTEIKGKEIKVADLSPKHLRKLSATDGVSMDLNIGETRLWRLDSGPNLQPWK